MNVFDLQHTKEDSVNKRRNRENRPQEPVLGSKLIDYRYPFELGELLYDVIKHRESPFTPFFYL